MNILFLGEIVGNSGIFVLKTLLPDLKKELSIDYTIVSGNATTGGFGIGKNHALYLRKMGVNLITGTDAIYFKKDLASELAQMNFILRPSNLPPKAVGRGFTSVLVNDRRIGIVNVMGQSGYHRAHPSNPFTFTDDLISNKLSDNFANIVVFHALATAEKQSLGYHLSGKVAAVIGYGLRSLTADTEIIDGTAYISDCGRIGSRHSVIGLNAEEEIKKLISSRPHRSKDAWDALELNAVLVSINDQGDTTSITSIRRACKSPSTDKTDTVN